MKFDDLYAEHIEFVWRCLRALGVPDRHLDDAAQEVFLVVHRGLAGFRGDSQLRTWLYGVVRNVAYKQARSTSRKERAGALAEDDELASPEPTPSERAADAQAAEFVQRFANTLDEAKREVFVLALLEQFSIPEVAEMTGVPLNTAYTRLRAVRAQFRMALERHAAESDVG